MWMHLAYARRPYVSRWLDEEGDLSVSERRFEFNVKKSLLLEGWDVDVVEVMTVALGLLEAIQSQRKYLIAVMQMHVSWDDDGSLSDKDRGYLAGKDRQKLRSFSAEAKELRTFIDEHLRDKLLHAARDHERKARHLRKMLKEHF